MNHRSSSVGHHKGGAKKSKHTIRRSAHKKGGVRRATRHSHLRKSHANSIHKSIHKPTRKSRRRLSRRGGAKRKSARKSVKKSKKAKRSTRKASNKSKKSSKKSAKKSKKAKRSTRKASKKHDFTKSEPVPYDGKCPAGFITRNSYKTRRGTKVPSRCIRKLTTLPMKREKWQRLKNNEIKLKEGLAKRLSHRSHKKCPKGMILRKGSVRRAYTRANGTRVGTTVMKSTCIKDLGAKGKSPYARVTLRKGSLGMFGYADVDTLSTAQRHHALRLAAKHETPLAVQRKLQYISTLNKRTNPGLSKIFAKDSQWVRDNLRL